MRCVGVVQQLSGSSAACRCRCEQKHLGYCQLFFTFTLAASASQSGVSVISSPIKPNENQEDWDNVLKDNVFFTANNGDSFCLFLLLRGNYCHSWLLKLGQLCAQVPDEF